MMQSPGKGKKRKTVRGGGRQEKPREKMGLEGLFKIIETSLMSSRSRKFIA